jgi:hypothetical protein
LTGPETKTVLARASSKIAGPEGKVHFMSLMKHEAIKVYEGMEV